MRIREYIQENSISIGTSGTLTYNLDYQDPITQLDLYFKGTNGATDNKASPLERTVSKIEIVDGGEVLWDLPGEVALAAYITDNEGCPYSEREESGGASVRQVIPIRFGLRLFDPVYAFDPRRHRNPQLRFTFNEVAPNTAGNDGYVSDSIEFTLGVRLMEGAPAPRGFLSYRTVESFTSVGTGNRRVELPTDRVIRYLMCRAYEAGTAMYTSISNHKLSADGGKWVPFDLPARDFMNLHCANFKPVALHGDLALTDAVTSEHWVGINLQGQVTTKVNDTIAAGSFYIYSQVYARVCDTSGASLTDIDCHVAVTGWGIHNLLMYPFGDRMNPADWLDAKVFNKLDYFVNDADADADVDICVQQVYPY